MIFTTRLDLSDSLIAGNACRWPAKSPRAAVEANGMENESRPIVASQPTLTRAHDIS